MGTGGAKGGCRRVDELPGAAVNRTMSISNSRNPVAAVAISTLVITVISVVSMNARCLMEVARIPSGTSMAVYASGDLVLFGSGLHLIIARDRGPAGAEVIAKTRLPGVIRDVVVKGDLAYVACGRRGLAVVDLSDPTAPSQVGFKKTADALDLAVHHDTILVAAGAEGLLAIDVSEPKQPVLLWSYSTTSGAREVLTHDGIAYLVDDGGVAAIDLVGPGAPSLMSRFLQDRYPSALARAGTNLFVTGFDARGLDVIDISNPAAPVIVGQATSSESSGWHIEIVDGFAAVANGQLYILDVTDPTNPTFLTSIATPGEAMASAARNRTLFVSDGSSGVSVVDLADPGRPSIVDQWATGIVPTYVERSGDLALVAGQRNLEVLDLSQPEKPVVRSFYELAGIIQDVSLEGTLAFIADRGYGLRIVDLKDPDAPVQIGDYRSSGILAVGVSGGLCVVAGTGALVVLDVTDPSRPELLGELSLDVSGFDIEFAEETAFLACHGDGLIAVDLADPGSPELIGTFSVDEVGEGSAAALTVVDGLAYVAFRLAGLRVLDVSDPRDMREIGQPQNFTINALNVTVDGALAFVSDWHNGIWVFDISEPTSVSVVDHLDDPGRAVDAAADSATVVFATTSGGLPVFDTEFCRFGEPAPPLSWRPREPIAGQPVLFTPLELDADEWEWIFDDGDVMTSMMPTQTFGSEGSRVVSLTVTRGSSSATHTTTFDVTRAKPRRASGRLSPTP